MQRQPITNSLLNREIQPPEANPDWETIALEQAMHIKCTNYISRHNGPALSNQNGVFGREHLLAELTEQGIRYFKRHLLELSLQPGFNNIHPHFLQFILDSDDLIILNPGDWEAMNTEGREAAVLGIVLKYLTVNRLEDDSMGEDLVRSVRLLNIEPARVVQVLEESNFSSRSETIKWLIYLGEALWSNPRLSLGESQIPESWQRRRVLARWQRGHVASIPDSTAQIPLNDYEISEITIGTRTFFGCDCLYLMAVTYRNYITKKICYRDVFNPDMQKGHYTVTLQDHEHITVYLRDRKRESCQPDISDQRRQHFWTLPDNWKEEMRGPNRGIGRPHHLPIQAET